MKTGVKRGWIGMLACGLLSSATGLAGALDCTVLTFNLRYITRDDTGPRTWVERRDFVGEIIKEQAADLVCVQEAFRSMLDDVHERVPGYGEAGVGREDGKQKGEYSAILYREAVWELKESGTFWLSDTPEVAGSATWGNKVTRICTWSKLRHRESGRGLTVFNAHFDHQSQPARERSAAMVLARVRDKAGQDPVIFTGDLNAQPDNPAIVAIRQGPPSFQDAWQLLNQQVPAAEAGTAHGFRGGSNGPRIDYIFVSPGIEPKEAAILRMNKDGQWPSDHYPVRAKLQIGEPPAQP